MTDDTKDTAPVKFKEKEDMTPEALNALVAWMEAVIRSIKRRLEEGGH